VSVPSSCPSTLLLSTRDLLNQIEKKEILFAYSHKNIIIKNVYLFNCYGLINFLLYNLNPNPLEEIMRFMKTEENPIGVNRDGSDRPCPLHYVAFQEALSNNRIQSDYWSAVDSFEDARPGDIICYSKPYKSLNKPDRGQHIMMVESVLPQKNDILAMTLFHTTGQRTSNSLGTGLFTERKCFKLNKKKQATHVQWSRQGKFYKRCLRLLRLRI